MNASFNVWHLAGAYGAFGSITRRREEVVVEGSLAEDPADGDWREYGFHGQVDLMPNPVDLAAFRAATGAAFREQYHVSPDAPLVVSLGRLAPEKNLDVMLRAFDRARELQDRLMPLHDAMFCEPSPAPAKYAASLLGFCTPEVRLPLVELSDAGRARVREAMQGIGLKV